MKTALAIVFCGVLALLAVRAANLRIADTFLDPIGRVDAQDEAMYAHSALKMARSGHWLTPVYLGRLALYKPPLLAWAAGASIKAFGWSPLAARLPVLLAASFTACIAFLWRRNLAAVLLLAANHLWFSVSTLCLTDGLLAAFVAGCAYCLWRDPKLYSPRSRWKFALLTAGALMAKSVAGALPLLILVAFTASGRRGERPEWRRTMQVVLAAGVLALPWCAYQMATHPKWFWNEFVLSEVMTYGVNSLVQTTQENAAWFYIRRMFTADPVLAVLAVPALWRAWRQRELALLVWVAVVFATALLWSYRSITYLVPAIPALAILAGGMFRGRAATVACSLILVVKVAFAAQPWGIDLRPGTLHSSATLLEDYARMNRGRELILVEPFEGFYSAVLPLTKVRYCFVSPAGVPPQPPLDLHHLGILVSAEEFHDMDRLRPIWRARLRDWGLPTDEAVATAVIARSRGEIGELMRSRPDVDYLIPDEDRSGGFHFVLAR